MHENLMYEMEKVVPVKTLINQIEPHYSNSSDKDERPAYPLATML